VALESDPETAGKCEIEITINDVENMADKGQYVYAHVAASKGLLPDSSEPLFKFNNGHFGGSHDVLIPEHGSLADGNVFAGSCIAAIKPSIMELLGKYC
jgi:hypothetical protein